MLKHIGKHNERKIVVLFMQVPDESHMCLLVYSDLLPRIIHDELMKVVESLPGQQSANLADALHRIIMSDGRNGLEVLHKEGFLKKVQTSQVIMTPTASSKIRLDELNNILAEMAKGEDAVKRLADIDSQSGMQAKKRDNSTPPRNVGEPVNKTSQVVLPPLQAGLNEVLSDEAIASQQLLQANKMRVDAKALLFEAERLETEAKALLPTVAEPATVKVSKSTTAKVKNVSTKETKKVKIQED